MPPEDKPVPDKKERAFGKKALIGIFDTFRKRPDAPKYTYEEQNKLGEEVKATWERLVKDKTPENEKANAEASEKLRESKADKKHTSAMMAPIVSAKHFLQEAEDADAIPDTERKYLSEKSQELFERLSVAQEMGNISDELVADTMKFMDELEIYLK